MASQRRFIRRTATALTMIVIVGLLLWFAWAIVDVLLLLLMSAILAAGFAPVVGFVERCHIPGGMRLSRGVAIFGVYIGLFALLTLLLSVIVLPAVEEAGRFAAHVPQSMARIRQEIVILEQQKPWIPDLARIFDQLSSQAFKIGRVSSDATRMAFGLINGMAAVVTVLVLTYYMLLEGANIKQTCLLLFPIEWRPRVDLMLSRIGEKFGGWLRGQLLLSFAVALPVALGLFLIGIPFPIFLGIIVGIGELIPIVGPMIGAAAAIFVALPQPAWQLVTVVAFYIIILNVEPHILVPRIMAQTVGLSPLLTVVALLVGIRLGGVLGGVLAVPTVAALQVILNEAVREIDGVSALVVVGARGEETQPGSEMVEQDSRLNDELAAPPTGRQTLPACRSW
jgi:predicted PurR-regulated permease PerM